MNEPNDLERAIAEVECYKREFGWKWPDSVQHQSHEHLLAAAKRTAELEQRVKELEGENVEFHRTEPFKKQECQHWQGLVFDLIKNFPHSEEETEREVIEHMIQSLQQLSQLTTAYCEALEALKATRSFFTHDSQLKTIIDNITYSPLAQQTLKETKV